MLPLTESDIDTASELIEKIVEDEVSKKFKGLILDLVLRAREESISENIKELIGREVGTELSDFIPTHFEKSFGTRRRDESGGTPCLTLDIGGRKIDFSGRIDRIDVNEADKAFVVIDYKKKKPQGQRKLQTEIEDGGHFQTPLYIMAARDVIFGGRYEPKEGRLVYIEWEDEKKRVDILERDKISSSMEKTTEKIGEHVSQIERGNFIPVSKRDSCKFCPYKDLCLSESRGTMDRREEITNR
jgi:ATP-dependent helicase/DNAse subunit B